MKEKYVDGRFPRWMIFGESSDGSQVDIATIDGDVAEGIAKPQAEKLIAEYNRIQQAFGGLALAFDEAAPEAFTKFWYR